MPSFLAISAVCLRGVFFQENSSSSAENVHLLMVHFVYFLSDIVLAGETPLS